MTKEFNCPICGRVTEAHTWPCDNSAGVNAKIECCLTIETYKTYNHYNKSCGDDRYLITYEKAEESALNEVSEMWESLVNKNQIKS